MITLTIAIPHFAELPKLKKTLVYYQVTLKLILVVDNCTLVISMKLLSLISPVFTIYD